MVFSEMYLFAHSGEGVLSSLELRDARLAPADGGGSLRAEDLPRSCRDRESVTLKMMA